MIVETGHYALVLALALALVQGTLPLWGSRKNDPALMAMAPSAAIIQFVLVAIAFGALTWAYLSSDFSLANVVQNSHSQKPLIYKFSGVWGNHEGSMLLWVLILAFFGALVAVGGRRTPQDLLATTLAVQGWISAAFLLFILLTSNPFARMLPPPAEGNDLNPILQDPGLAIHPPMLYLGYVGFSITFSFAAAALINGRIDAQWARYVRPWTLTAWIFLTLGIAMGSYWAYYTLGWGGFWFWDPVENASLMPWLAGTALLHSATVMEKRDALKIWTIFLAILAFSLSLLGTFLVRSGVLTSVHAFATDPQRGVFILAILVFFIGGSLALFALRGPLLKAGGIFAPISREGALVFNNLLLTTSCATVFVGTLYPLALEALTGDKISVGPPFFNYTFIPLFVPLFLAMPLGQVLAWKRGNFLGAAQRLVVALIAAICGGLILAALQGEPVVSAVFAGLALFVMVGAFVEIWGRISGGGLSPSVMLARATGLPWSAWGTAFAHAGVGVSLLGLAATGWGVEKILAMRTGDHVAVGPYELTLDKIEPRPGPNYDETVARMTIRSGGTVVGVIEPSRKFYRARQMTTTDAGLRTYSLGQIYAVVTEQNSNGMIDVRLYWKPYVALIWIGAIIMALGGAISLADRRLRVGVARRSRHAAMQPAE
ncbi:MULTISPECIES: heme lyase CcmF/NrfE family subunit [unclassified Beijerinckia]|uniref:heme lyase CcmF/NrfE family subunit n=1 Tax=unclassified Beijerinckia TaxID=2638183 RepID=UPI0008999017|nr:MULTISPECIES: heme lyase CcmF/NrfE family subunit [unclassified Beijerinckia]MDH7796340.1 cytochrome c-type biogenesis protein CcmF [Beijerinckia sp. GAS462]SEC40805.1 cytochrome c-type biogenesis protein CcmF [Beijerinckia sp. 28-YEA-48]